MAMAKRCDKELFQLAGFADEFGRMGRMVVSNLIRVPNQIEFEGGWLTWEPPMSQKAQIEALRRGIDIAGVDREMLVSPRFGMLSEFIKLASANSADSFLDFAKRYGVFGAVYLPPGTTRTSSDIWFQGERWQVSGDKNYSARPWPAAEPIALWRQISRSALAMLRVSAELDGRRRIAGAEEWEALYPNNENFPEGVRDPPMMPTPAISIELGRIRRLVALNQWLEIGRVGFRVIPAERIKIDVKTGKQIKETDFGALETFVHYGGHYNLFGAIAVQLMLVVARKEVYLCSACRLPFMPKRRPKDDQNRYCEKCGPERARYDADRRRKDKMIEARRLASEGFPLNEIAARVHTQVSTARKWIKSGISKAGKRAVAADIKGDLR